MNAQARLVFGPAGQRFLRWSGLVLIAVGIGAVGYCGFVLADARVYQAYQSWRFQQSLKAKLGSTAAPVPAPVALTAPAGAVRAKEGSVAMSRRVGFPLGRIEIGSLGVAAMIMEGTDDKTLRRGVGHIPGTALPGERGNVALAGHRDTFFRDLRNIRANDEITIITLQGAGRYSVDTIEVVGPQDVRVLDASPNAILTLVTCYPFRFVGAAPERFIVRAHRID